MSPPLTVTEDTPPDMLAGAMDLLVVLPNGHNVKMSVERSTPMMDLLVQITTTNKISPGGHAIRAYGDRGILPYQPSTPIGALDTWSVHIVPKKSSANAKNHAPFQPVSQNTPFEQTFRLQVNLPRNQLYVSRVSYKMRLEQVFRQVCDEKNLDPSKYCLVHPEKPDQELNLSSTFLECKLQKVTLLLKSNRPAVGLSSVDIMELKRLDNANQRCGDKYYASHSYDGSVSSGSLEGRSLSPVRSDESSTSPTTSQTNATSNKPFRKRRPAPKPPSTQNGRDANGGCESLTVLHSRNSSDSSGYHESSVLSESPGSNGNSLAESLPRKSKLSDNGISNNACQRMSSNAKCSSKIANNLSRSLSNLATDVDDRRGKCSTRFPSNGMKPKQYSASSTSLSTIPGKRKKAPAPPPPHQQQQQSSKSFLSLQEEEMSSACSNAASFGGDNVNVDEEVASRYLDVVDARNVPSPEPQQMCSSPPSSSSTSSSLSSSVAVDSGRCSNETSTATVNNVTASQTFCTTDHLPVGAKDKELIMDDDEIDRIFRDATKGYESAPSSTVSSPPQFVESNVEVDGEEETGRDQDLGSWQYALPSPPKAFRDQMGSPPNLRFDAITSTNVGATFNEDPRLTKETVSPLAATPSTDSEPCPPSAAPTAIADRKGTANEATALPVAVSKWESKYPSSTHDSGLGSDDSIPSVHENKVSVGVSAFKEVAAVKPAAAIERRASTLQNFTISTYQNSKPTEIFHDDSVKTWKTTELAKSNRPFATAKGVSTNEKCPTAGNLGRHCSFNAADRTSSSLIKRSKSHISLLSGNFAKFNRLGKLDVKLADEPDASAKAVDLWTENKLRSHSLPSTNSSFVRMGDDHSQITVTDADKEEEELIEPRDRIHLSYQREDEPGVNHDNSASQLQSLQILKNILPRIDKTQYHGEHGTLSLGSGERDFKVRKQQPFELKTNKSLGEPMPSVNLQSWNERPCRQVSIKTDRDYVFSGHNNALHGDKNLPFDLQQQQQQLEQQQQPWATCNNVGNLSRVPVVTAVEFKKPFTPPSRVTVTVSVNETNNEQPGRKSSTVVVVGPQKPAAAMVGANWPPKSTSSSTSSSKLWSSNGSSSGATTTGEMARSSRITGFTFKEYKNKMASKEKFSFQNGIEDCTSCTAPAVTRNLRNHYDYEENVKNSSNNNNCNDSESFHQRTVDYYHIDALTADPASVKRTISENGTLSIPSAPTPPPPPLIMPTLKPVNRDLKTKRPYSAADLDPRDLLLSSIKNFDRDSLRKLRVK